MAIRPPPPPPATTKYFASKVFFSFVYFTLDDYYRIEEVYITSSKQWFVILNKMG